MSCNSSLQNMTVTAAVFDVDGITSSWPQKLTNVTSLQDNCLLTFIELLQFCHSFIFLFIISSYTGYTNVHVFIYILYFARMHQHNIIHHYTDLKLYSNTQYTRWNKSQRYIITETRSQSGPSAVFVHCFYWVVFFLCTHLRSGQLNDKALIDR